MTELSNELRNAALAAVHQLAQMDHVYQHGTVQERRRAADCRSRAERLQAELDRAALKQLTETSRR